MGDRNIAFITGITGQDGSYLAEFLLEKGYEVHGLARRNASQEGINQKNIQTIKGRVTWHKGDITDSHGLAGILGEIRPREIYHLAAQSHVSQSFKTPDYTMQVNTTGTLNLLQAIVVCGLERHTKLYNAVNGILFNHESPRRGSGFVTMRIARGVGFYSLGIATDKPITLAGVDMARDWGHARDYVSGMWAMLQQETPTDMVLATGRQRTVKEFVEAAFRHIGIEVSWLCGKGPSGRIAGACNARTGKLLVKIDDTLQRAVEVPCLLGDSSLARRIIGWRPITPFETLVGEMVDSEIERLKVHSVSAR
ncbi:putative GDP-mannose 4,6 dehydratase [Cladorrhinum sp. PSN332]|nr:putative GDP-mannose 4,6 dehydratase [Cladorrhinum sp. PSN332]